MRELRILLRNLASKVSRRAINKGFVGHAVTIKLKFSDFQTVTRSATLDTPTNDAVVIGRYAVELLNKAAIGDRSIRLAGTGITQLAPAGELSVIQLLLPLNK